MGAGRASRDGGRFSSRLSLLLVLESHFAGLLQGSIFFCKQTLCQGQIRACNTVLTRLWTHGGKIGHRGAYTNFLESTVKEVCKAVLLVDLECVARSSSVSCTSPGQLLTDTERLTVSCVTLEGVCGFFL